MKHRKFTSTLFHTNSYNMLVKAVFTYLVSSFIEINIILGFTDENLFSKLLVTAEKSHISVLISSTN